MSTRESDEAKVARLARESVRKATEQRGFSIVRFGVHDDGYFHARVTINGQPFYVHRRYGSWMAPGTLNKRPILKEIEAIGGEDVNAMAIKTALQKKARAAEQGRATSTNEEVEEDVSADTTDEPVAAGSSAG